MVQVIDVVDVKFVMEATALVATNELGKRCMKYPIFGMAAATLLAGCNSPHSFPLLWARQLSQYRLRHHPASRVGRVRVFTRCTSR